MVMSMGLCNPGWTQKTDANKLESIGLPEDVLPTPVTVLRIYNLHNNWSTKMLLMLHIFLVQFPVHAKKAVICNNQETPVVAIEKHIVDDINPQEDEYMFFSVNYMVL